AGFIDVLDSLDLGNRTADGGIELTRAVAVLEAADAMEQPAIAAWSTEVLLPPARANPQWSLAGRETGLGLAFLFDRLSPGDDESLAKLLAKVEAAAPEADAEGHLQLAGAAGLADGLIKRGRPPEPLRIRIAIPPERLPSSLAFFGAETLDE